MIRPPAAPRSRSSASDDLHLCPAGPLDQLGEAPDANVARLAAGDRRAVRLEQLEQSLVAERGHLDRLAERGPDLAFGERPQQRRCR